MIISYENSKGCQDSPPRDPLTQHHAAPNLAMPIAVQHHNGQTSFVAESSRFETCYANNTDQEQGTGPARTGRQLASLVHSLSLSKCRPFPLLCFDVDVSVNVYDYF